MLHPVNAPVTHISSYDRYMDFRRVEMRHERVQRRELMEAYQRRRQQQREQQQRKQQQREEEEGESRRTESG